MRLFLFIMICFFAGRAAAQQAREFSFKNYSVLNGLASNAVRDIIQDKEGYIWIATKNGLQRFDGGGFITFNSRTSKEHEPLEYIKRFFRDKKDRIWILTDRDEVGLFDTKHFRFTPAAIEDGRYMGKVFEGPRDRIMLMRYTAGFYSYDEKENRFVADRKTIPLPEKWIATDIHRDQYNRCFWISSDSGLINYNLVTSRLNYRNHNPDNIPAINAFGKYLKVSGAYGDRRGNLLFNRWPHMSGHAIFYRYHRGSGKIDSAAFWQHFGYHEAKGYLEQQNGKFWLYGMPFLAEWPWNQPTVVPVPNEYKNEQSIKYDYINSAYEDREHNIWLATDNGVFYFNPEEQIFDSYKLIRADGKPAIEANVHTMRSLDNDNVLVGCWGAGFFLYDKNFKPVPFPKGLQKKVYNTSVWDMAVHPKTRDLWVTLQGGGLIVYSQKNDSYKEFFPEIFEGSTIRQIDEDTSGNIWFGTHHGLVVKWDYKRSGGDPTKGFEVVLKTGMIMKIHYDYQGYIYVSSSGNGLYKIDAKTNKLVKHFTDKGNEGERLFNLNVGDMTYYNDSTLIVSAGCLNILNTKTHKITYISAADGLPFNATESVERDRTGIVWVGMTNGICRVNIESKLVTYYDRRDGIPYDKFTTVGVKELPDGRMAFFTDHNFLVFDPKRFVSSAKPPQPVLTSVLLAGRMLPIDSLLQKKQAVLPYNNTSIELGFSSLSYLPQRKLHYYYMLENFDEYWIRTDKPARVTYNYLPPGEYVFRIKSVSPDGLENESEVVFPITVRPPFWKTWWFFSLAALMVIAVLYLLDKERMNKLRSMQLLRRQIRGNLKDEVTITLNNINVLSEMAKIKADKNLHQAKVFIDQISDKSRTMMEVLDDTLWSIDPQNDSMAQTLLRINEVTEGLEATYGADIDLMVDKKVHALKLDMKVRHDFFFYYKDSMQFVLHQLQSKQVFVNISMVRSKLKMEILTESNGSGYDNVKGRFRDAVEKRVADLPATLDLLVEGSSFSALLNVDVKK